MYMNLANPDENDIKSRKLYEQKTEDLTIYLTMDKSKG